MLELKYCKAEDFKLPKDCVCVGGDSEPSEKDEKTEDCTELNTKKIKNSFI